MVPGSDPVETALQNHRAHFPALQKHAYFNYGGQGPLPQQAIASILQAHEALQQVGPFSNQAYAWIARETAAVRAAIAQELQVSPATIALTENVSVGCNIAIWGIDWREGDHLLLSDCEHPSVVATAEQVRQRFGVKLSYCSLMATLNQGDPIAAIAQSLRPTTRLVAISHILWNTGQVLPLKEIVALCRSYDTQYAPVRLLVDAAQSVGVLPLNLTELGVDFYAFTGHKWLCGPAGIGGLYVRPETMETLHPTFIGWRGVTKDEQGNPTGWEPDARRYEVATSDFPLFGALQTAIALHQGWGTAEQRYHRICTLSAYLWQRLTELPQIECLRTAPPEAGLVSFRVNPAGDSTHKTLVQALEKQGFLLRTILHPDCIRACVHYLTLESEIDQLIEALQHLLQ